MPFAYELKSSLSHERVVQSEQPEPALEVGSALAVPLVHVEHLVLSYLIVPPLEHDLASQSLNDAGVVLFPLGVGYV